LAFKSNIELKPDQVQYLRTQLGKAAVLENRKKGTSAEQLLAYLDSRNDVSYLCVFDKVDSKLLKFNNQKGQPSKKQKICELAKSSKRARENANPNDASQNDANPNDAQEIELSIPPDDDIWLDAQETREAMKLTDFEQVLLAVAWVSEAEHRLFQLFPEVTFWDTAQKTKRGLCFLPAAKMQTTVASRTFGHLCQANQCGSLPGFMARPCQLSWDLPS
jgi:hypothetical protein